MFIWCVCPFISSMGNNLGMYDGFSAVAYQVTSWGLPYFIGRIYFNDLVGLRELAIAIVISSTSPSRRLVLRRPPSSAR